MNINKKLFDLRKSHGYSQQYVADRCTVSQKGISQIETGHYTPFVHNVQSVLAVYGLKLEPTVPDLLDELREWSYTEVGYFRNRKDIKLWSTYCEAVARVGWTVEIVEIPDADAT